MKTYSLTFTAGQTLGVPSGNFFMIMESSAPVDVSPFRDGSPMAETGTDIEAGYTIKAPVYDPTAPYFDGVEITSDSAQTIKVAVSRGMGEYQKQVGVIQTRPAQQDAALNQTMYAREAYQGAVAGEYPVMELYNPADSGKIAVLADYAFKSSASGTLFLSTHDASGGPLMTSSRRTCKAVHDELVTTVIEWNSGTSTVLTNGNTIFSEYILSTPRIDPNYRDALVVFPGRSLLWRASATNTTMRGAIMFYEVQE